MGEKIGNSWWKVPLYCIAAGWLSFWLMVGALGRLAIVTLPDGTAVMDDTRWFLLSGLVFAATIAIGGFCLFCRMTKRELFYSASVMAALHVIGGLISYWSSRFVGAGGVSFFQVMPTYHNPSGNKAYIMNMYTHPNYRRRGIAYKTLELLVREARDKGITAISLEATDVGRPLYEKYGFITMAHEMELPE